MDIWKGRAWTRILFRIHALADMQVLSGSKRRGASKATASAGTQIHLLRRGKWQRTRASRRALRRADSSLATRTPAANLGQPKGGRNEIGFDLIGRATKSEAGRYFGANIGAWSPIVAVCFRVAPSVCRECRGWKSNNGDGLDQSGALAFADALQAAVERGALNYEDALSGQQSTEDRKSWLNLTLEDGRFDRLRSTRTAANGKTF
jgi:hypothetical protein